MRRKRRFYSQKAGRSKGRDFFWIRFTPFTMDLRQASSATHADIMLTESDWANPNVLPNQTRRGGARLERLICEFGLSIQAEESFWDFATDANFALIPEFMIWHQTDQFVNIVTTTNSFDETRENQRVLMDVVPPETTWEATGASRRSTRSVYGRYETKSKVRLAEGALGVGWRGSFDTTALGLLGYTDWVRPTLLISTP